MYNSKISEESSGCTLRKSAVSSEDWRQMSLVDKWKSSYRGDYVDTNTSSAAQILSIGYFWFISTTELYCFLRHIIPEYLAHYPHIVRSAATCFAIFTFVESVINWIFTRSTKSFVTSTSNVTECDVISKSEEVRVPVGNVCAFKGDLSWGHCHICDVRRPPRSHHCKICDKCVLKRDHHCFMTGVCIGFYNQRYFIALNFYIAIASIAGLGFTFLYLKWKFMPATSYWDYFIPVAVYNWWSGLLELHYIFLLFHMYTLWWTAGVAIGFIVVQLNAIVQGKTTHEVNKSSQIKSFATTADNFRSVFGPYWAINLLFPIGRQIGDGANWTSVKQR